MGLCIARILTRNRKTPRFNGLLYGVSARAYVLYLKFPIYAPDPGTPVMHWIKLLLNINFSLVK